MSLFDRFFHNGQHGNTDAGASHDVTFIPQLVHWIDTTPVASTDQPCTVSSLKVDARVRGIYAEVTQTITIHNPNRRDIAAQLAVPLPDRAVVCGYALEIEGQLVEGVVVPKEQARVIFETEQRRRADPGLVEATRGNVYRTRVYPIDARGHRTVRLSYVAPLLLDRDGSALLDLPMPDEHLDRRTMHLAVERLEGPEPQISGLAGAQVQQTTHDWSVETDERDLTPTEAVRVCLPALPASLALLERDPEGTTWFCVSNLHEAPAEEPAGDLTSLTVLWDASGSRAGQDHARERELLRAYASAPTIGSLTLVVFADHVHEVLTCASADELVDHIHKLTYDGGTDLAALARALEPLDAARAGITAGSACVLFTDGLDTLSGEVFSLPDGCSCLALVTGTERDAEVLRQGCRGPVVDLAQAPRDARELAALLLEDRHFGLGSVRGTGFADVCDVSAPNGSRRAIIGRLSGDEASLQYGDGDALTLRAADARAGSLLARAWAARRISVLSPRANDNTDELLRLGRRFGMASPATSLLVLESIDQWLRYEIEPPASLPRMRELWRRRMEGRMQLDSDEGRRRRHREDLADEWKSTMAWWKTDYAKLEEQRQEEARQELERHRALRHAAADGNRHCPDCGAELTPDQVFCHRCGRFVGGPAADARPDETGTLYGAADLFEDEALADSVEPTGMPDERFVADSPRSLPDELPAYPRSMARTDASPMSAAPPRACISDALEESSSGDFLRRSISSIPEDRTPSLNVAVAPWMPDTPHLKALDAAFADAAAEASLDEARKAYFGMRGSYCTAPSFFLDCAGWFMAHDDVDFGVSVLTNLAELRIEDAGLLRVLAWRLREAGRLERALVALRRVVQLRGEDSQSYRDLALVLSELAREALAQGDEATAKAYAEEAGELYRKAALTPWRRRAIAIGLFAVEEYNVLRAWAEAQTWSETPELPSLGEDLEGVLACDLRITLAWDADETDVDIHVTEPSGEEAYYAHRMTTWGGRVSEDITDGFGPELYEIRTARPGTYTIRAHYFASHQQTIFGPATCTLTIYTDWGRPEQAQSITSRRLDQEREMIPVGTATYGEVPAATDEDIKRADHARQQLALGMEIEQVIELFGEPVDVLGDHQLRFWRWRLPNDHTLTAFFEEGKLAQAIESTPWGDTTILIS